MEMGGDVSKDRCEWLHLLQECGGHASMQSEHNVRTHFLHKYLGTDTRYDICVDGNYWAIFHKDSASSRLKEQGWGRGGAASGTEVAAAAASSVRAGVCAVVAKASNSVTLEVAGSCGVNFRFNITPTVVANLSSDLISNLFAFLLFPITFPNVVLHCDKIQWQDMLCHGMI